MSFWKSLFAGMFWPRCTICDQFYDECEHGRIVMQPHNHYTDGLDKGILALEKVLEALRKERATAVALIVKNIGRLK